ncbi:MAG: protein kinase [Anaerolineales bacterium]|nr:protein kinase [Chloroflexota bacterium]MBL6980165.1 protein kinase [Anaerolineales bacterium]
MDLEKIGRYQIKNELGRGGMATVYQATDPNFERDVAIKVLPRAFLHDPQFRQRFEREAKTVAALEHAAIVPVYDFGEDDGQPYIVMRMMSGGDLAEKLKGGSLTYQEAAKITERLAAGLDAAHTKGIVHRDMKPGNILFDQYDNAYLSDFGIARLTHGSHTLTGENIIGTPAYMSPEQVQGEKALDGRSDLYSLGIIFYQMLTGDTPYQATTPAKVMMMHILDPVPDLALVKPDLPAEISLWLQKSLAKEPDERFETAKDMEGALHAAAQGRSHHTLTTAPRTAIRETGAVVTQQQSQVQPPSYGAQPAVATPTPLPTPLPAKSKRNWLSFAIGGFILLGIGAIIILATAFMGYQGRGPLAAALGPATSTYTSIPSTITPDLGMTNTPEEAAAEVIAGVSPTPTEEAEALPTNTEAPPTETPEPTATSTPEVPTLGGADKIAFINEENIWVMNVDGSDLQQLTNDGTLKTDLAWTPDGQSLTYISGKCVWSAELETGRLDFVACFESAEYLDSFAISPDGTRAAISVNRALYIVPYDINLLKEIRYGPHLEEISECPAFAPLKNTKESIVSVQRVRWSDDGEALSLMVLAALSGVQGDIVQIFPIGDCETQPYRSDEFPSARFNVENYERSPYLQNFGFDGNYIYAITSYTRNDGFGQLYLYNGDLHKAEVDANPINGECCYRDPQFSPDGHYLIFAYQPFEAGATTELYIVPYGTIGTGAQYQPISLPDGFFTDTRAKPQPVFRPVSGSNE